MRYDSTISLHITTGLMETSILTPTQKYAAAGLFALALHQAQINQTHLQSHHLLAIDDEPISQGSTLRKNISESDNPELWIHDNFGLLFPVFRFLGLDEHSWDGLKETAGSSSQLRHHIAAFLELLSDERDGDVALRTGKELALSKTIDATIRDMQSEVSESHSEGETEPIINKMEETTLDEGSLLRYQRKVAVLYELLSACITDAVDIKAAKPKGYDARHRVALRLIAVWLSVAWRDVEALEVIVAFFIKNESSGDASQQHGTKTLERIWSNIKRGSVVGAAALVGGTLMAVTGGMAAPAIAEGIGVLAPAIGATMGTTGGSIAVATSLGVAGAGLTATKMARRVGDLEEFAIQQVGDNHNKGLLGVGIFISGFVSSEEDFVDPWKNLDDNLERYILKWESKHLLALTAAMEQWLTSQVAMKLMKEGAMLTVLSTLVTAVSLSATLVTASDLIDSTWAVALDRSNKAGELLAEVLMQQKRPITLVGFSLGARVIFQCLQSLAESGKDGIVERAVLLGAPVAIQGEKWRDVRKMVAGRFVNAYSTNDWTLGIVGRASLFSSGLAGIQPVETPGIENVDVSHLVEGHSSYRLVSKQILQQLDLEK